MNFLKIFAILLLNCHESVSALEYSDKLKAFEEAVNDAKRELENLKSTVSVDDEDDFRHRRKSVDHIFENLNNNLDVKGAKDATNEVNEADLTRGARGNFPYMMEGRGRLLKALRAREEEDGKRYNFNAALFNKWGPGANFRKSNALSNSNIVQHVKYLYVPATNNYVHIKGMGDGGREYSNMNGGAGRGNIALAGNNIDGIDDSGLAFHKSDYSMAGLSRNGPGVASFASTSSPFKTDLALSLLKTGIARNKGGDEINLNYRIPPASKSMMSQSTIYGSKMDDFRNYGRTTQLPIKEVESTTEGDANRIMYEDGLLKPEAMNAFAYLNRNHFRFDIATTTERTDYSRFDKEREELENSLRPFKYPIGILRENITESPYEDSISTYSYDQTEYKFPEHFLSNAQISRLYIPLNDQFETKKNNLSHEADYKLSKMEQDASERFQGPNVRWGNGEVIKRSSSPFNPMNEIKLKTSRRLMKKGYGPSLPSYSLSEARKEMLIDHMLQKKEQELNRGVKRMRNRMSDSFSNDHDFYYDGWMDGNEGINDDENMGIHSNDAGMDDFDMRNIDYVRQKRISHVDPGLNKNCMRKFKKSRSDQTTVRPAQGESNRKAPKSKTTQEKLKSSERTESQKDEKMVKNEKTYKNDGMGNEKDKHSGKGDQDTKVRHKKKKEEKEKSEKKEKLEKAQNNERTEDKDRLEEKDKTEKTEKPITKNKSKTDQNGKRLRTQRQKDKHKSLKPGRFNERVLVARDEGAKLQNEGNSLHGLSHASISPDFDYTNNIEGIIDRYPDQNRQFAADTDINDLKPGGSLELDSGLDHLMNGPQRIQRDTVDDVAGVSSRGTKARKRKRSATFKMKNELSSTFGKTNSVRGSMTAKDVDSSTQQVGVDYNHVVNPATKERSTDYISNFKDSKTYRHDFQESYGPKMRQKRSLGTEREDFEEKLWDFDSFELNEDNIIQRFKRSLNPKPEVIQKPHRIKRRNVPYFSDDYLSKANYQVADVDDDPRFLGKLDRQKEETIHDFDFDSARKSFGREEFDNLKQKDPKFAKFNGMKFDNVKWDKSYVHEREQKSANDKKAFMEMMSDENQQRNNDIPAEMKKSDGVDFNYNLPRSSDAINDEINDKTLQEAFNTGIKPDYRNFWLATGNTKRENNKLKDNKKLEDKVRKDSKDNYLKDINDFNRNYKFNENHFNWGQHYNNFGVESSPYLQNWLTNKQTDDGLSTDMHNDVTNYSAFTSLDNFLKTMPRNNTLGEDTQPTSPVICDTESMPGDLITTTTQCITTTKEKADSTTECVTTESSAATTAITTTTEATKSGTDASSTEEECIISTTELTKISTTTASEVTTECEEPSEKSTEKTTESTTEEEEATTECVTEGSTEVPPTSPTSSTGESTTREGGAEDELKLNITINANVLGRPKQKTFLGNGSIQVMPGYTEDRNRRETYATPFEELKNRKSHHDQSKACTSEHEDAEDLSKLASGKLSSQMVKSVFCMVKNDPNLKALWPSLKRRQPGNHPKTQDLYAIRNENNEGKVKNTENMLRKAMDTINCIVEEQVRSRNCVPLRPDLQDFYETVLRSNQEQDKCRDKRDYTMGNYDGDFSKEVRALDPNKIEEKSRIVKKLLKQYEELPQDDQEKVVGIRDDLLKDLLFLRKLKESEERRRRELFEKKELGLALDDDEAIKRLQSQYTPQFLKLLKTSDLYREMATEPDPIL